MKCLEENSKQQFQKMSEWMECVEKKSTQQFEKISMKFDKLFNMMEESSLTVSPSACPRQSEQSYLPSPSPTRTCTSLPLTSPTCTVQQPLQPIFQNSSLLSPSSTNVVPSTEPAIDQRLISRVRSNSRSRENFTANLVRELFSKEDRLRCNVAGKCGKGQLQCRCEANGQY